MDGILLLLYIITVANIAMLVILSVIFYFILHKVEDIRKVVMVLEYRL